MPQTVMQVQVPAGALPGSTIQFMSPTGQLMQGQVPPGTQPGEVIQVNVSVVEAPVALNQVKVSVPVQVPPVALTTGEDTNYNDWKHNSKEHRLCLKDLQKDGPTKYELVEGRACYSGKFFSDWRFHVKNSHPWFSICYAHNLHDYSRVERASALFITLCFHFVMAMCVEMVAHEKKEEGGSSPGALWLAKQVTALVFVTLPGIAFACFLKQIALLDYRCGQDNSCCTSCTRNVIFCSCGCFLFMLALAAMSQVKDKEEETGPDFSLGRCMNLWITGQVQSVFVWCFTDLFIGTCPPVTSGFFCKYRKEKAAIQSLPAHKAEGDP